MHILPHHFLSRIVLYLTRIRVVYLKNLFIDNFCRAYDIDLTQSVLEKRSEYPSFNAFFTRELKPALRPLETNPEAIVCPADGTVSQFGKILAGELIQAKGKNFTLVQLLGLGQQEHRHFERGEFATIYLSPADCHRLYMPLDGTLVRMVHVPGRLFSVNQQSAEAVPDLFARNERVIVYFQTSAGMMAFIMVGAIFVSSIETIWSGVVTPPSNQCIRSWDYPQSGEAAVTLKKGEEVGRFNMGSTVILLFEENAMSWADDTACGKTVQFNQRLGHISNPTSDHLS